MGKGKFTSVCVWRSTFGEASFKAICELYRKHKRCTNKEFSKTSFGEMVDYLRQIEDPDYIPKQQ